MQIVDFNMLIVDVHFFELGSGFKQEASDRFKIAWGRNGL